MDARAASIALTAQGAVLELNQDGDLKAWSGTGNNWVVLRSSVQSFGVAGDGDAIMLDSAGMLQDQWNLQVPGDSTQLASGVQSFVIAGNGDVVFLDGNGTLYDQWNPQVAGDSIQIAGGVQSVAIAGNGNVIMLDSAGALYDQCNPQVVGDFTQFAQGVRSFAIAGNGDVICSIPLAIYSTRQTRRWPATLRSSAVGCSPSPSQATAT